MYAPKLIGLSIMPVISFVVIASLISSSYSKTEFQRIRDVTIIGFILVSCHVFHLYLVKQWLATLSN